jgi:hypothetical protein
MGVRGRSSSIASGLAAVVLGALPATAVAQDPFGAGYRYCGQLATRRLTSDGKNVSVYAHNTTCGVAIAIQRADWTGPSDERIIHNGRSQSTSYMVLRQHPRWICRPGVGIEVCKRHAMVAAGAF